MFTQLLNRNLNNRTMESNIKQIEVGNYVFKEGDKQVNIYFLQSGLVILHSKIKNVDSLISPGQVLEIYNPYNKTKHHFTATALTDIKLLLFPHKSYLEMWQKTPEIIQTALKQSISFNLKHNLNLGDENSIDTLFSLLKMIYWSGKDAEERPVSINQIILEMKNLKLNNESIIKNFVKKLDSFSIIKSLSESSFLLKDQPSLHLLIMQDMILTKIPDPWEFYIIQNHLSQLLYSMVSKNTEVTLNMESFVNITSSSFHSDNNTIRKILQLWVGKNFIRMDKKDKNILIVTLHGLKDLQILLNEYKYYRNKILNLLLVNIPVYKMS